MYGVCDQVNAAGVQTANWNWQQMRKHEPTFWKTGIKRLEGARNHPGVSSDNIRQFSLFCFVTAVRLALVLHKDVIRLVLL